jgi:hypothetical protein
MVRIINGLSPLKLPSDIRDDYTLLNAHPLPRYAKRAGYVGKTEPSEPEVMCGANIARLTHQIKQTGITRLLLAGKMPQCLTQSLNAKFATIEIFWCGHPSKTAWNTRSIGQSDIEKIGNWTRDTFKVV